MPPSVLRFSTLRSTDRGRPSRGRRQTLERLAGLYRRRVPISHRTAAERGQDRTADAHQRETARHIALDDHTNQPCIAYVVIDGRFILQISCKENRPV